MTVVTKQFPAADAIYAARFGVNVDGSLTGNDPLTWAEMRAHFSVSARSSRFLAEVVALVNGSDALLARHPEMAHIDATDKSAAEFRDLIRAERTRGVGMAMLGARTGLSTKDLKLIVGEEVGTTARVGWRARYSGAVKPAAQDVPEGGADAPTVPDLSDLPTGGADAPAAPAAKPRSRKRAAKK